MSAPQEDTDPPIIIQGGSVTIEFDENIFTPSGRNKHSNANKKITSIVVAVEGEQPTTFEVPNGKVVVTVNYGNGK